MKRFVCCDIIPGCDHVVTGASDQSVLDQVITHVAVDHGLVKPPLALVELVVATTRTLADVRPRGHLRLVGSDPAGCHANGGAQRDNEEQREEDPREVDFRRAADQRDLAPCPPTGTLTIAPDRTGGSKVRQLRQFGQFGQFGQGRDPALDDAPDPHERYRHECQLYRGVDDFVTAVLPFVMDGVERGQQVMVAVAEPRLQALREALGDDAGLVIFADMAALGRNPASIIPVWREFAASSNGRAIRGVGEPIWAGRSDTEIVECQFHEALLNLAVAEQTPLWLLCPYDTESLSDAVIVEALHSHPYVIESEGDGNNRHYGGAPHARSLFAADLPEPDALTTMVAFDDQRHGEAATRILRFAANAGLPAQRSAKLVTAIDEIATAALRDTGSVRIRLWRDEDEMVCEVVDRGIVDDPMIGRGSWLQPQSRERGIRLANELCDIVSVRSNDSGTTVRVHSRL